jgi:3-deoxy-7-phosphoheptulonate synthase
MACTILLRNAVDAAATQAALQGLGVGSTAVRGPGGECRGLVLDPCAPGLDDRVLGDIPGVSEVLRVAEPWPLVAAQRGASIEVAPGCRVGGGEPPILVAGPCAAESEAQVFEAAAMAARHGARVLRGGAFKPRTSPYAFRGHGFEALGWLRRAADAHGLALCTEAMGETAVELVAGHADWIQVGSRTMASFGLLEAVGRMAKPVLLKRGMSATIDEWMLAAEHLLCAGARGVVFCERGLRGFDPQTRNLLDLGAVALLKHHFGQPVVVDPSHALGRRDLIPPMARAALACGADGLIVEAHPDPAAALSDGPQALTERELAEVGRAVAEARR